MKWLARTVVVIVLAASCLAQTRSGLVFLVRHAEKESQEKNALLTEQGHQRAQCLARLLADAEIRKIFVTTITRTQQTAEPLTQILGLTPIVVEQKDIQGLVTQLLADTNDNVLVVAHSETLPNILSALGAKIPKISQDEFDRLLVFHYDEGSKQGTVTTLRYCTCN